MSRPRTAFTLVELLVVMGILTVLVGIMLPAIGQARMSARNLQCKNNLRQIALGFHLYAEAHRDRFPTDLPDDPDDEPWYSQVAPFLENSQNVFRCPLDPEVDDIEEGGTSYGWRDETVLLPSGELSDRIIDRVASSSLVLVFDRSAGWHVPGKINVATIGAATMTLDETQFEEDLLLNVKSGNFFSASDVEDIFDLD
jgi:prepilin-type N-terminal cleavage/methylation domain-containing protein